MSAPRRVPAGVIGAVFTVAVAGSLAGAQPPTAAVAPPIRDNSFLIEEAYNQEWGVVQHVGTYQRMRGGSGSWGAAFTQEWPVPGERHQLSYTIPFDRGPDGGLDMGQVAISYRYQVALRSGSPFAVAPRVSLLREIQGSSVAQNQSRWGAEVNIPVSAELSRLFVTHFNLGANWTGDGATLASPSEAFIGGSLIFLAHPRFNLMVEALASEEGGVSILGGGDGGALHVAPGFRGAIDFPSGLQVVPGVAFPIGAGRSSGERGIYLYLSFEHPFRRR